MKATIVLDKDFSIKKVIQRIRHIDVQDENWFFTIDTAMFKGFASFLSGQRFTQWSGTVDNRVLVTFNNDLSPTIISLANKADLTYPYDIDVGNPVNDYNVAYVDLGVFLAALDNPAFNTYNPVIFQDYINAKSLIPSVQQIVVPQIDLTPIEDYEAANP